jgi:hypothetical protein
VLSREALPAAAGARPAKARRLIDDWQYFTVHAPRQTGKTTALRTLSRHLTAEGRCAALTVSCERAGELDFPKVLDAFAEFWAEHEEIQDGIPYREVAMQLAFMAFLTRAVNGDGVVDREYGVGRGRIDLLVRKPYGDRQVQREAIELKVWHPGRPDPLAAGIAQLDRYLTG